RRLPLPGQVVPHVLAVDGAVAAGPGADQVGPQRHHTLHEEGAPVVADEVDDLARALDLVDQPVDVGFLRRLEAGRRGDAEAGKGRCQHVAARQTRPQLVPEAVRVRDAVDEEGGHPGRAYPARVGVTTRLPRHGVLVPCLSGRTTRV